MYMHAVEYPGVGDTLWRGELPNGLGVYVVPRPGFQKKQAFMAVDYGGAMRNFTLGLGVRWENFNFGNMLHGEEHGGLQIADAHFYSYNAHLSYNSEDDRYFTTRGATLSAMYSLYTDDFVHYLGGDPLHVVSGRWRVAARVNSRLTLQPMAYGRLVLGNDVPWCLGNFVGGDFAGHYMEQQLPFAGIGNVEMAENCRVAVGLKAQQRVMDNNYIMLRAAFALSADKPRNLLDSPLLHGYQLSWAYNSLFGPVNANVGYSSKTRSAFFYLNLGFEF